MSPFARVEAVAFDMDGLLVDSECAYRDAMIGVAADMGRTLTPETFLTMIGTPQHVSAQITLATFGEDFNISRFDAEVERRVGAARVALKAGVLDLMAWLDDAAIPFALVTNNGLEAIEAVVGPHGLLDRFHTVVFRGETARGKPHPDPYLLAAARMGVEPGVCLALEDSHNGVRSAHAAGMITVMVPDLLEPTDEIRSLCTEISASLQDVLDLLRPSVAEPRR